MQKKKWLSIFLVMVMAIAMIPSKVFAAGGEATADGVEYPTLEEALTAGGNVKLLRDVEVNSITNITKSTVLDLGNYTIVNKVEGDRPFHVSAESFTINASGGGMEIPAENTNAFGFVKYVSGSNFSVNGGNYIGSTNNGAFFRTEESTSLNIEINNVMATTNNDVFYTANTLQTANMQVNGGTYTVGTRAFLVDVIDYEDSSIVFDNVAITADRGPCIELSGGNSVFSDCNFNVTGDFAGGNSWARSAIGVGYEGRVTIESGTYTANGQMMGANEGYGLYIYSSGGEVNINGGTFVGKKGALRADVDKGTYGKPAIIHVFDGNFEGDLLATTKTGLEKIEINSGNFTEITEETLTDNNSISVSGGVFDNSMKQFITSDLKFESSGNGEYTYYPTLQDAMNNADANTIITPTDNTAAEGSAYFATLDYNDGTGKTVQLGADADGKITIPEIERNGYIFLGWDTGNGNLIAPSQVYTITNNITMTAQWKELTKIKIEAKEPTCIDSGNIEYWYCPELDSYFSDEALTKNINLEETILPATGKHSFENGKCTICGTFDPNYVANTDGDQTATGDQSQTTDDKTDADKVTSEETDSDSPKTGDDTMVLGYVIMMLAALGIGGTLVVNRKKN